MKTKTSIMGKHTLSSIKKPAKPPKTVLINNVTDYWPVLNDIQIVNFKEIMKSFTSEKSNKQKMSIGLESTLRSIKNKSVKILLISNEISPGWFAKHLVTLSLSNDPSTKILIIPNMKNISKELLDIPSIICSVKTEISEINEFYKILNIHDELLRHFHHVKQNIDVSRPKTKSSKTEEFPPIVYLKRTSDTNPAFRVTEQDEKMEFDASIDFISLAKYDDPGAVENKAKLPLYRPLKVKKVVGNVNRKSKTSSKS